MTKDININGHSLEKKCQAMPNELIDRYTSGMTVIITNVSIIQRIIGILTRLRVAA